ncbi:hypothetical protein MIMGU_mgv1a023563mg [Erythranthe guttata]|uniref:VQ domain-containing protein n=1 Tax=Erythranthe guttata TaxID=4155 RepID=A0A022RTI6_ERYGU|nr:PREDICTED: VQ motif-containing protein 25-like [Erythranthe guttata]EYU42250.1 hypothetical protein MIMGU_mgv1a023563mg [Erythranthe guttata]|eukprot:XP_012831334.1 PREDICTED: VQ motif-containing protein 25-like [Erythranthe guttata]
MKGQSCSIGTTLSAQKLAIQNGSHVISKQKPIIRIIHIVAPEIIKTDVGSFRDLVQKLTGKPLEKRSPSSMKMVVKGKNVISSKSGAADKHPPPKPQNIPQSRILMKREYISCEEQEQGVSSSDHNNNNNNNNNPNSFLNFLGEGIFMHDVNHEFPLLTFRASSTSNINAFGNHLPLC